MFSPEPGTVLSYNQFIEPKLAPKPKNIIFIKTKLKLFIYSYNVTMSGSTKNISFISYRLN